MLQTAAVIGKDVRGPILEQVVDVPAAELAESLANLRNVEFIYETRSIRWPNTRSSIR